MFGAEHFPQPMNQYRPAFFFWLFRYDFEEMDQLYEFRIIHLFALSGMQVGFFHQWDPKALLRLGILQETVDIWMVPISLVYAGLTGFLFQWFVASCRRSSLKGHPRDGEYGDDLDDLNGAHAQVSPDSWRGLELCLAFILTLVDTSSYSGLKKKLLVESFWISLGILPFDLLL